jgi:ABC-type polysaccharide transport system permease subunit
MVYFSGASLALELALGLAIALYFNRAFKGSELVQAIYIIPFAATPVAVALIWQIMLNPEIGVMNYLLTSVGLPPSLWVSSEHMVIPSLVMVDVWKWTPMITLIVLAGLKSLPSDPYEAARLDGASALQIFWYITLPLIRPVLIAALMLRFLDNLKEFDMLYTITQGGPGIASETLYLYSYNVGFNFFKAGYGAPPGAKRRRHLGDHVLHLLLEPVSLLADSLRTEDENGAGLHLRLLRPEVHRPGPHDGRPEGLRLRLQRANHPKRSIIQGFDPGRFNVVQ